MLPYSHLVSYWHAALHGVYYYLFLPSKIPYPAPNRHLYHDMSSLEPLSCRVVTRLVMNIQWCIYHTQIQNVDRNRSLCHLADMDGIWTLEGIQRLKMIDQMDGRKPRWLA